MLMSLNVVKYGHPALRKKGARIEKLTPEIKELIKEMLERAQSIGEASSEVRSPEKVAKISRKVREPELA